MCVGLSAKVVKISDGTAVIDAGGAKREVSAQLLEDLEPGDYVMASGPYPREERLPRTSMIAPTTSVDFCLHHFNSS